MKEQRKIRISFVVTAQDDESFESMANRYHNAQFEKKMADFFGEDVKMESPIDLGLVKEREPVRQVCSHKGCNFHKVGWHSHDD